MSRFVQLSARVAQQSLGEVRAPGVVGLFVQGIQTGLVVSQWAQWLNLERRESTSMIALVVFVTVIGLLETGICFASAWRIYVLDFGQFIYPHWTDSVHVVLVCELSVAHWGRGFSDCVLGPGQQSTLTGAPIQAFFIWRCYHILKKRIYVIIPLVLALITSVVLTVWVTLYIFRILSIPKPARPEDYHPTATSIWWPFVACLAVPAALDVVITSILLYSLTTFLRRIHTEQLRGRIMRFLIVVWQAAIPPGLCAVALVIKYMVFTETHPGQQQKWYGTIQAMLGKLYILSLFYTLNNRMDFTHRPPVTYASTVDPPSLESAGSPTQRRVYSVHFPDTEEC
ncbi:hypothetical protein EDB92DRAFT_1944757 [Lactarius akahatsu]|uniref:DUF6534 domain-containing protein n=1 Tax=Lactarius akahatsu TaxID=416441 RepID=A0AAD4LIC5_9AGAM|nr:hypothetical protein EDB92DRAFT_1944757 [Lactarius akahatsu]